MDNIRTRPFRNDECLSAWAVEELAGWLEVYGDDYALIGGDYRVRDLIIDLNEIAAAFNHGRGVHRDPRRS